MKLQMWELEEAEKSRIRNGQEITWGNGEVADLRVRRGGEEKIGND